MKLRFTVFCGNAQVANISGMINRETSHPQANRRNDKSCHSATKVKIRRVDKTGLEDPPSGMYIYLIKECQRQGRGVNQIDIPN